MQKGNTLFYHDHIQSNIAKLEERKDKFVQHRMEFLKEYCEPIQERIREIYAEVERYKTMRDTQEEVIENEEEVVRLKQEVSNYMQTHQYFQQKLDQYEKKSLEISNYNQTLQKRIREMQNGIRNHKEEIGFHLPDIARQRIKTYLSEKEPIATHKSFALPQIGSLTEEVSNDSRVSIPRKRIVKISDKIQRMSHHNPTQSTKLDRLIKEDEAIREEQLIENKQESQEARQRLQDIRDKITSFNRTEALFRDCFETKKAAVQKSVSQLQSKLIVNREQFLNICQAIGAKEQRVSFAEFSQLSGDEIITLFISFVWLNRKLNAEFVQKRKSIMEIIGKLPKNQS